MIVFLAQLEINFEPAFVFPGERFAVVTSPSAIVKSDHISIRKTGDRWLAVAPATPSEIWATVGEEGNYSAAEMRELPIASGAPVAKIGELQLVPMHGGAYGAILSGKRFAELISFTLAPRSAPLRQRRFNIDYRYLGPDSATLGGDAGGLLRVSVRVTPSGIHVEYATRFDLRGSVRLLDREFIIASSPPGAGARLSYPFAPSGQVQRRSPKKVLDKVHLSMYNHVY